jgi:acyl-coenzyme A synthetase/AMP-(fatty) acid ligase
VAVVSRPDFAPPSEAELCALVKDRLRSSRVPERIVMLDTLPYNEMGKLLRREVRKLFQS